MKINKIFFGLASLALVSFVSCKDAEMEFADSTTEPVAAGCPAVGFSTDNAKSFELDPSEPMVITLDVVRKATAAASYTLNVIASAGDYFEFPLQASFAEGATTAQIQVSVKSSAPVGQALSFTIGFADADINPYVQIPSQFTGSATVVKWNNLGMGQLYDDFWYEDVFDVAIEQRDDDPSVFRFNNPYTDDVTGGGGTYTQKLTFNLSAKGLISWDGVFYFNTMYDAENEIGAYYPSYLSDSQAQYDANSCAVYNEDGSIRYFVIAPYWYMPGLGGWGPANGYNLYLLFPGQSFDDEE